MRIPIATYRLQFYKHFRFPDARDLIAYLSELGISDIYASPIFKSRAGTMHGYDVVDHSQVDPALGGETEFATFSADLRSRGMGLILDIVPNHMGIAETSNSWWMDVLENGPSSSYASYFDIDWHPVNPHLENKVLLPILEDQYGNLLEEGKLKLVYEDGAFFIGYHDT
ncbi:MAG TPA: alpha-amylase family glycosyl hydrolase, partial [Candidatus Binatia bacterium]|nr:alpha-amylase family glycosyl hydrolase [Candidatus Binatia bacterium]